MLMSIIFFFRLKWVLWMNFDPAKNCTLNFNIANFYGGFPLGNLTNILMHQFIHYFFHSSVHHQYKIAAWDAKGKAFYFMELVGLCKLSCRKLLCLLPAGICDWESWRAAVSGTPLCSPLKPVTSSEQPCYSSELCKDGPRELCEIQCACPGNW